MPFDSGKKQQKAKEKASLLLIILGLVGGAALASAQEPRQEEPDAQQKQVSLEQIQRLSEIAIDWCEKKQSCKGLSVERLKKESPSESLINWSAAELRVEQGAKHPLVLMVNRNLSSTECLGWGIQALETKESRPAMFDQALINRELIKAGQPQWRSAIETACKKSDKAVMWLAPRAEKLQKNKF